MALAPGTRLGVYEVTARIGEGGMGQVFRARDTKLDRDVAIKVLPEAFAHDADRLARFTREAKTLASLNHPHIAAIYGLEESAGVSALVMELVEGEDLAQRIARGPIPLDEALPIARQIADALEAAHEQGIIHRDLKPANIKVRPDGTVKVLDFGLAKAIEPVARPSDVSQSPTITTPAMMTGVGLILGTAAYMAPEQARGKTADKRADIWAFGVVVFEMLTGRRLFTGETISDTLAAVLKTDPDWRALPDAGPSGIRRLLRRCLEKDPKRRLQAIGEARVQIEDVLAGTPEEPDAFVPATAMPISRRVLPWSVAALSLAVAAVTLWAPWREGSPAAPLRLSSELGADVSLAVGRADAMSLSRDSAVVAFVAQKGAEGNSQLYVRRLAQLQATGLSGTDGAESPFFSPDGQWVGFFAGGKLKKISVTGGATVTLCDAPTGRGGTWAEDGSIIFAPDATPGTRLMRVSSSGGAPELLAPAGEGDGRELWPQILPGGKAVLFTRLRASGSNLVVQVLSTGTRTVVQRGGFHGRYLASGTGSPMRAERGRGHLVYLHDGTLFAAPFDLDRLSVTGPPVPALDAVVSNEGSGAAQFAVSAGGTLVFLQGQSLRPGFPIYWTDRRGQTTPLRATPADQINMQFAPNGRRVALQIADGQTHIWVYEWARDALTRLTSDTARDEKPVWTPDGRRIAFASARPETSPSNLYSQRADGTGDAQRLTQSKNQQRPTSWHPSGKFLAFDEVSPVTNSDLMILPMAGDEASGWQPGPAMVFLNSVATEREAMFSPDGRWVAYASNETGREEVYVRPFPGPGGKSLISTGGGSFPTWSRTKRELVYSFNGEIMVASYATEGDAFRAEKPRHWSDAHVMMVGSGAVRQFDLHPDGERVAVAHLEQAAGGAKQNHITFIFNFFDELRRIAPMGRP